MFWCQSNCWCSATSVANISPLSRVWVGFARLPALLNGYVSVQPHTYIALRKVLIVEENGEGLTATRILPQEVNSFCLAKSRGAPAPALASTIVGASAREYEPGFITYPRLRGRQSLCMCSCCHRLHIGGVDFHRYGLRHHVYGKNEIIEILLPNQNPFNAFEGAPRDANPLTTLQEKMGFYAKVPLNDPSDRLNLLLRDDRDTFAVEQNRVDSWSCKDFQSTIGSSLNEDITRKKGQGNSLLSVFPESH